MSQNKNQLVDSLKDIVDRARSVILTVENHQNVDGKSGETDNALAKLYPSLRGSSSSTKPVKKLENPGIKRPLAPGSKKSKSSGKERINEILKDIFLLIHDAKTVPRKLKR